MKWFKPVGETKRTTMLDENHGVTCIINTHLGEDESVSVSAQDSGEQARFTIAEMTGIHAFMSGYLEDNGGSTQASEEASQEASEEEAVEEEDIEEATVIEEAAPGPISTTAPSN